ncbi:MAG: hypothetical protein LBS84_08820, partial [Clostridiales bacterium]|nr:hypothetical protein [Clostridiales bacterium]
MPLSRKIRALTAFLLVVALSIGSLQINYANELIPGGNTEISETGQLTDTERENDSGPTAKASTPSLMSATDDQITYNIYYYRTSDKKYEEWVLYAWPNGGAGSDYSSYTVDANKWAKYTYTVNNNSIGFFLHHNSGIDYRDAYGSERFVTAPAGASSVDIYIVEGKEPNFTSLYTYRLHYIRQDNDFTAWQANIWSGNISGSSYDFTVESEPGGQTGVVSFTTVDSTATFFIHEYGKAAGERDPADSTITLTLDPDAINGNSGDFYIQSGSTDVLTTDPRALNTFNVYYYRQGGYAHDNGNWNAWYWDADTNGAGADSSNFGASVTDGWGKITISLPATKLGLILKAGPIDGNKVTDGNNRLLQLPSGQNTGDFYLVEGDDTVYSEKPITLAKVVSAIAVELKKVEAVLNIYPDELNASDFKLYDISEGSSGTEVSANVLITPYINLGGKNVIVFNTNTPLDPNAHYEVRYTSPEIITSGSVTMRKILNSFTYSGNDLGLTKSSDVWTFKLWAPSAKNVDVVIYNKPSDGDYNSAGKLSDTYYETKAVSTTAMTLSDSTGVWSTASVPGPIDGKYYMYKITYPDGTVTYAVDPYARSTAPNGQLTYVIDMDASADVGEAAAADTSGYSYTKPTDAIIYELHVRDFSIDSTSGMTYKGKYLAFTEVGKKTSGGNAIGIDHLKELGVTHVQLQPVFDFASVNELGDLTYNAADSFNWG